MRFVFMDEAGTSQNEPVTVVVGLIVNADKELLGAEAFIREILEGVPSHFMSDFVFHATDVWGSPVYRDGSWSMADRLGLLKRMMSVPKRMKIPISLSIVRREAPIPDGWSGPPEHFHHVMAFSNCVAKADKYIRDFADHSEVGTIVAEDVPEMRRHLRRAVNVFRNTPMLLPPDKLQKTQKELDQGYWDQEGDHRVSRIRKPIHFVEKPDEAVVWVADACAFGFRRYFAEEEFGDDFLKAILGPRGLVREDWAGFTSFSTFRWAADG